MHKAILSLCLLTVLSTVQAQYLPILKEYKRGLINLEGEIVVPPIYDDLYASPFGPYYYLKDGHKTGLFQAGEGIIIVPQYDQIVCEPGSFRLAQQGKWGLADSTGQEIVAPVYERIDPLVADVFLLRQGKRYGARSLYHGLDLAAEYVGIEAVLNGGFTQIMAARDDGQTDIFDLEGKLLAQNVPYQLVEGLANGSFVYQENGLFGMMDSSLTPVQEAQFLKWRVLNGMVLFGDSTHWGMYLPNGEERLPMVYDSLIPDGRLWWTKRNHAWGWTNDLGRRLGDTLLLHRPTFQGNVAKMQLKEDSSFALLNQYGNWVVEERFRNLKVYPAEEMALAIRDDSSRLQIPYDSNGAALGKRKLLITSNRTTSGPTRMVQNLSQADQERQALLRLGWRQVAKEGEKYWGLIDTVMGNWLVRPTVDHVQLSPDQRFAILRSWQDLGTGLGERAVYRIWNHQVNRVFNGPMFLHVFVEDLQEGNTLRVMTFNRAFALLHMDRTIRYQMIGRACYIGPWRSGRARIYFSSDFDRYRVFPEACFHPKTLETHFAKDRRPRWLYLQTDGDYLVDSMNYQYAGDFVNGIARVKSGGLYGLINTDGEEILSPTYRTLIEPGEQFPYLITAAGEIRHLILGKNGTVSGELQPYTDPEGRTVYSSETKSFQEGFAPVKANRKWSYASLQGEIIAPFTLGEAGYFQEGLAPAKGPKGWGFLNTEGKWVIEPQFKAVDNFQEGLAPAKNRKGWGYLSPDGRWAIKPRYRKAYPFENGQAIVRKDRWGVMDKEGKWIIKPNYVKLTKLPYGYQGRSRGRSTLFDLQGKVIVPPLYSWIGQWGEGILPFIQGTEYGFLDTTMEVLIEPQYKKAASFSDGLAPVRTHLWGYINPANEMVIEPQFLVAEAFDKGVARVAIQGERRSDRLWGLIDPSGKYLFDPIYHNIERSPEGYYFLQKGDTTQYLDPYGIPLRMEQIEGGKAFQDGFAVVQQAGGKALLDLNGNFVFPQLVESISPPREEHFIVQQQYTFGLIDRAGKEILPATYQRIQAIPDSDLLQLIKAGQYHYLKADGTWLNRP